MTLTLTLMTVAGGLLPLIAIVWGGLALRADYRRLVNDLEAIDRVIEAPEGTYESSEAQSAAMYAIRQPAFNFGRLTYTYEWAQRLVWEQARSCVACCRRSSARDGGRSLVDLGLKCR
ncbi:hypothetical protein QR97_13210 [Streptomyces sp. PBH53]|uniref:hypothetical protein n=1 Tax=Streptomyces TaxID=1883 RepID=UPI0006550676|nr:hypothetical protein [Streptomyces sp. PBH53]AKN70651.1 hypothetical protein QR97_13210 [Streptomyces sp. PBH53]